MVGGDGTEFGGEQGAVIGAELVGVQTQAEAQSFRGVQDGARLVQGKHVRFAEDVAVFGEVIPGDPREHLVDDEIDIVVDAAAILVGDLVSAEERRDAAQMAGCVQLSDGPQDFDFGIEGEAVSRFGFDGGGASAG